MKRLSYYCAMALVGALAMATTVEAQVTMRPTMSYQGYLTNASGTPLAGTHTMTINFYENPNGGAPVWSEAQTVTLNQGLFNVILGKSTVLNLPFNRQYWIGVSLDGAAEMTPRAELAAVPYSLHTLWADSASAVAAGAINAQSIANGAITLQKLSTAGASNGQVLVFNNGSLQWTTPSATNGVTTINGMGGSIEFVGSGGTTVTRNGNTITISSTTGGSNTSGIAALTSTDNTIGITNPNGPSANLTLVPGSITGYHIAPGTITEDKLSGTISASRISGLPTIPTTLPPSGVAGGVLTGTYPNPGLANGAVTTTTIADNAVTSTQIMDGSVSTNDIANGAVTPVKLNMTGAVAGQTLVFNGTNVVWGNPIAGGLTLPYAGTTGVAQTGFAVTGTGTAGAGSFTISNPLSAASALVASTNGNGLAALLNGGMTVNNGSVLFTGTGSGAQGTTLPATGAGSRMMWVPALAAFRAGCVTGTEWDSASVGRCSFAVGNNNMATGQGSFAAGDSSLATGSTSFALGIQAYAGGTGSLALGGYTISRGGFSTAMGASSAATGDYATALGYASLADGNYTIAAGFHARACGPQAFSLGRYVEASGSYSLALGNFATTNMHEGSVVIGDNSSETKVMNTADNQFMVRAAGGVVIYTDASLACGMQLAPGCGSWQSVSDRNKKANFRSEDGEKVLARLSTMPITSWNYKTQDPAIRHIGPMAQDFHAAFGFGESDTTITGVDIDGINMLAIQALEHRTAELKAKIAEFEALRASYDDLRKTNDELATALIELRAKVDALATAKAAPTDDRPLGDLLNK